VRCKSTEEAAAIPNDGEKGRECGGDNGDDWLRPIPIGGRLGCKDENIEEQ
jgi:hypothetical protein